MEERTYTIMSRTGGWNIAIGIATMVVGITAGVLLIISGAKLLIGRSKIMICSHTAVGFLAKYKFTNKRHPLKSIMAVNLALIAIVSLVLVIWLSYRNGGQAKSRYALSTVLAELMALVGLILAIASRTEPDRYYLFPDLGIVLNGLVLIAGGVIFALGIGWI